MTVNAMERTYLDYNATAPCRPEVAAVMSELTASAPGNPSSLHAEGRLARAVIEDAREEIATAIGAAPLEIVFTGGGTESDNLAIFGSLHAAANRAAHVVTSVIEHPAVLEACRAAERRGAARVTYIPCDGDGRVDADAVMDAITDKTVLVSLMHANNEVGSLQPVAEVGSRLQGRGIGFHCDAVQSLGRVPVMVDDLGANLLSISGHKLGGPKGIGLLYVRRGVPLSPVTVGGAQERERRAGTENVVGIAGLARAVSLAVAEQAQESRRLQGLKRELWEGLRARVPDVHLNGDFDTTLPNTLNLSFENISGEDLMIAADLEGVAVSTGSACAVGAGKPSHVIEAMGLGGGALGCGPLRVSMGYGTTRAHVVRAIEVIAGTVERLRAEGTQCCCTCRE